jgi:hypothetical protein
MSEPEKGAGGAEAGAAGFVDCCVCVCVGDAVCGDCVGTPCCGVLAEGAVAGVWLADVPVCCARRGAHATAKSTTNAANFFNR